MATEHELDQAIMEGHRNAAAESYFSARSDLMTTPPQIARFDAGFSRGWDAGRAPLLERIAALEAQVEQAAQPSEQAAFEDWLHRVCPSGDVTDVKRQWEASSDLAEWLESQRTEDVLIDGVAYTVPIEVACELLHLHMALLTKPAQAAQPVYQVREAFVDDPAGTWRDTWEGPFYMVPEADRRIVYASPPKAAPLPVPQTIRTNSQIEHELEAMNRYIKQITKDKSSAVAFLSRAGIIDGSGELAEQYRAITPATVEKG